MYKSPKYFASHFQSMGLSIQEKKFKIYFQDGNWGGHLGFPIGTILAIFDLQVTSMILTKFQVNWRFGSGEEAKNRFSRWPQWRPSWISDRNDFSYFDLPVTPKLPTKFRVRWPFGSGKEAKIRILRSPPFWISHLNNFSYFWSTNHPKASYLGSCQLAFRFGWRNE